MSGFQERNVGFDVGKYRLPDKHQACVMKSLATNCRVCRVFIGVESPGEMGTLIQHHLTGQRNTPCRSDSPNTLPKFLARPKVGNLLWRNFDSDRKSTRLNSSHRCISYAVFC